MGQIYTVLKRAEESSQKIKMDRKAVADVYQKEIEEIYQADK
jgi:hypothetical protein